MSNNLSHGLFLISDFLEAINVKGVIKKVQKERKAIQSETKTVVDRIKATQDEMNTSQAEMKASQAQILSAVEEIKDHTSGNRIYTTSIL